MNFEQIENEELRLLKLDKIRKNGLDFKKALNTTKNKIKFLESIYMSDCTCGLVFSQEFKTAALQERQCLCITSSALHSIIREETARQSA